MKLLQIIKLIYIILIGKVSFSQTNVMLYFEENCQKIKDLEYNLCNLNDYDDCLKNFEYYSTKDTLINIKPGVYYIDVYFIDGKNEEFAKSFNLTKEFKENKTYRDTIRIPEILRKTTRVLHYPEDLGFFICDSICDGEVIEYYENGNIKSKGVYENGKPVRRTYHYNEKGELIETKIYNSNGHYKKSKYNSYEEFIKDY